MDISLNAAFTSSSTVRLTQSTASIKAQADAVDATTTKTFDTPAAVYHPSAEAVSLAQSIVSSPTFVGRPDYADFPAAAAKHQAAHYALKASFDEFKSALAYMYPDLAEKKFSFTIIEDGSLKALNTSGELNAKDLEQLDSLLNASSALKNSAAIYRDASIEMVAADAPWGGSLMGEYVLNKENFAKTIDLGALFIEVKNNEPSKEKVAGWFTSQLWSKGQYEPAKFEIVEMSPPDAGTSTS